MKPGDLVRVIKNDAIGIVMEIFADIDVNDPWVRVLFSHPHQASHWCRKNGLEIIKKEKE